MGLHLTFLVILWVNVLDHHPPPGLGGAFGDARPGMPSAGNSGLPGLGLDVPGFGGRSK